MRRQRILNAFNIAKGFLRIHVPLGLLQHIEWTRHCQCIPEALLFIHIHSQSVLWSLWYALRESRTMKCFNDFNYYTAIHQSHSKTRQVTWNRRLLAKGTTITIVSSSSYCGHCSTTSPTGCNDKPLIYQLVTFMKSARRKYSAFNNKNILHTHTTSKSGLKARHDESANKKDVNDMYSCAHKRMITTITVKTKEKLSLQQAAKRKKVNRRKLQATILAASCLSVAKSKLSCQLVG